MNRRTQMSLLAAWEDAKKSANGHITLTHASAAGMLIERDGSVGLALTLCPPEPWWDDVRAVLRKAMAEE